MPEELHSMHEALSAQISRIGESADANYRNLFDRLTALREDLGLPRMSFAQLYADLDKLRIERDGLLQENERLTSYLNHSATADTSSNG